MRPDGSNRVEARGPVVVAPLQAPPVAISPPSDSYVAYRFGTPPRGYGASAPAVAHPLTRRVSYIHDHGQSSNRERRLAGRLTGRETGRLSGRQACEQVFPSVHGFGRYRRHVRRVTLAHTDGPRARIAALSHPPFKPEVHPVISPYVRRRRLALELVLKQARLGSIGSLAARMPTDDLRVGLAVVPRRFWWGRWGPRLVRLTAFRVADFGSGYEVSPSQVRDGGLVTWFPGAGVSRIRWQG